MTSRRPSVSSAALLLALGLVAAVPAPADAAKATYTQPGSTIIDSTQTRDSAIDISVPQAPATSGAATPYPDYIGYVARGVVTDVDVTLMGVSHSFPDDMDVLLVSPQGQQVELMSDVGGSGVISGVDLTFDDEAAGSVPDAGPITSGSYRPTNAGAVMDSFPAPAPALNAGTSLSVFDGVDPTGYWDLFVVDDSDANGGSIDGWKLTFTMQSSPYPSTIQVDNQPATITDLDVTLDVYLPDPTQDFDLMLVGPGGQQVTLMSDVGGVYGIGGGPPTQIILDDEAPVPLPTGDVQIEAGTYRPTNDGELADAYPPPAPASTGATNLSVFDGVDPNGTWSLYTAGENSSFGFVYDWALDFTYADVRAPTGAITIAGGAASTSTPSVMLSLDATDPQPGSGLTQMRFSNDGTTFSPYQPYATSAPWTLSPGEGAKTVYAQFQDAEGNQSLLASDTITLDLPEPPDTTGPHSTTVRPKNRARDVSIATRVKVKASEKLLPASVSKATVLLTAKGATTPVKARVKYDPVKRLIVMIPRRPLKKDTVYSVTVRTAVEDLAGNAWDERPDSPGDQALRFRFRTA